METSGLCPARVGDPHADSPDTVDISYIGLELCVTDSQAAADHLIEQSFLLFALFIQFLLQSCEL